MRSVSAEGALVLPRTAALRNFHDLEKNRPRRDRDNDAHRKLPKLRARTLLDEIFVGHVLNNSFVHYLPRVGRKPICP